MAVLPEAEQLKKLVPQTGATHKTFKSKVLPATMYGIYIYHMYCGVLA